MPRLDKGDGLAFPETPYIERQDTPRPVDDGKGLNYASFSDSASSFDVFEPKGPHVNPAGHYAIVPGSGVDNTRSIKAGTRRKARPGRARRRGGRVPMVARDTSATDMTDMED